MGVWASWLPKLLADSQISQPGNLPDYHVLHPSVHRFIAWMPTDLGGLPDLLTWKSAGWQRFFPSIYTLIGITTLFWYENWYYWSALFSTTYMDHRSIEYVLNFIQGKSICSNSAYDNFSNNQFGSTHLQKNKAALYKFKNVKE